MANNSITFVSLGPGESDLITLKGLKKLQRADCIYSPSTTLKNKQISSRALDIIKELDVDASKVKLFDVPMSKNRSLALESYQRVSELIYRDYEQGLNIVITAEGDAGFYSSSHYIIDALKVKGIEVEKVPGVPAFISAGALARIHISQQEEQLHVVPGVITEEELCNKLDKKHAVVIMKASQCVGVIQSIMPRMSSSHSFHYFENIGLESEFYTSDIDLIHARKFPYFSLLIIKPL